MQKIIYVGVFLLVGLLFLGVSVLTVEAADHGDTVITLDVINKEIELKGGDYDLDSIWSYPGVTNKHLVNETDSVWLLNWSIVVDRGATLVIDPVTGNESADYCTWLKLNSTNASGKYEAHIDVQGRLFVNDTTITGWNYTGDCNMTWNLTDTTFRSYIYIVPLSDADTPEAYFLNSTIGYLGWNKDNKYGIVYEDNDISGDYDSYGWMHNCTIWENYIGINFQGCENMNVTNTWINNTHEVGIVYTVGGATANGAHGGYIGVNRNSSIPCPIPTHPDVSVDYCTGAVDAMGIRLCNSDNITMDEVNIQDAHTEGLYVETCDNLTADDVTCYLNTNAANDFNIYLKAVSNSTFGRCTAFSPNGAANGGNWFLYGATHNNTFNTCWGFNSSAHEDFYLDTGVHHNTFTECMANNSEVGFYCLGDNHNTFIDCIVHNHVVDYLFWISQYNNITGGFANDSASGVYIYDDADYNTVTRLSVNRQSSYGIKIGTTDDISHNNTIEKVVVVGTTNGAGIYIFGNCTYNRVGNSSVTGCAHTNANGLGLAHHAHHNTFYNCDSNNNGDAGFNIIQQAHNNSIWHCNIHNNTKAGVDIGSTPINYFYESNIPDNTGYGFQVEDGAVYISNCDVYNPASTRTYDFYISNASNVDIYNRYILGYDKNINFQFDTTQPYGLCAHDPGDGLWSLNTTMMTVHCNAEKDVWVNLTDWTGTTYRKWYVTGVTGDYIYQKIGGLASGTLYQRKVNGADSGTYYATTDSMLGYNTGIAWFNYTGTWSTQYFELLPYSGTDNGNGGGGGGGNGNGNGNGVPTTGLGALAESPWFWLILGILAIAFLLLLLDWMYGWFGFWILLGLKKKKRRK